MTNKPYVPANGTEGTMFEIEWCCKCSRRALDPNAKTQCLHELRAFFGENNKKWYSINGKPTCLAFRDRTIRKVKVKIDKAQGKLPGF